MKTNGAGPINAELIALIVITLGGVVACWVSLGFPMRARIYPLVVALSVVALGFYATIRHRSGQSLASEPAGEGRSNSLRNDLPYMFQYVLWFGAFYIGIATIGLATASGAFVAAFLGKNSDTRWRSAIMVGAAVSFGIATLGSVLNLRWPASVIDPLLLIGLVR